MKKSYFLFFALLVSTFTFAQQTVVSKNGKLITVNAPSTPTSLGLIQLAGDLEGTPEAPKVKSALIMGKLLNGFSSAPGTVTASDSIVSAFSKLDGNIALKANIASPTFTGTPSAPTAAIGTTGTQIATLDFVNASAPNATTTATGKIQLAQDLGNTATAPKVIGIQGVPVATDAPMANQILQFNADNSRWEPASVSNLVTNKVETVIRTSATQAPGAASYQLSHTPIGGFSLFINGVRINDSALSIDSSNVVAVDGGANGYWPDETDEVVVVYVHAK
nr:hypothetical protein [uncultured Flavobacterium sp.]